MTWQLTWLNVSIATLNATLPFLVILVIGPCIARFNEKTYKIYVGKKVRRNVYNLYLYLYLYITKS